MKPIYLILISSLFSFSLFAQSNWRQVNSGTNEFISSIQFEDSLVGYATAGNQILKSVDAGENWSLFYQDTTLLVYGAITLYQDSLFVIRVDTGLNFQTRKHSVQLINKWNKQLREFAINFFVRKLSSIINAEVWIQTNESDGMLKYNNGVFTEIYSECNSFSVVNNNTVLVSDRNIVLSDDYGQNWDTIPIPPYDLRFSESFYNGQDTIIISKNYFPSFYSVSYDRGLSWGYPNITPLNSTTYFNSKIMLGLRINGNGSYGIVYSTTDGGINYKLDTLTPSSRFFDIYQYSKKLTFVYGENGVLFKTTNLGGLVSINENKGFNESDFAIFPNPSQDYLQIRLADKERFSIKQTTILSANGAVLATFQSFQERIELSAYPKGMYVIQLQTDKGSASKSFVVR